VGSRAGPDFWRRDKFHACAGDRIPDHLVSNLRPNITLTL